MNSSFLRSGALSRGILIFGILLAIAVIGCVRLPILGYHLMHNGVIDEKEAVDSAGSLLARKTLEPPGFAWGNLSFYINAVVFGFTYGALRVLHIFGLSAVAGPEDFAFLYLTRPEIFLLITRVVSSIFGLITCAAVFVAIRNRTGSNLFAAAAGLLLLLDPLSVLQSGQAVPDAMMTCFAVISFLFSLKTIERAYWRDYICCGLFLGFAAATKYNGILVAPAVLAALYYGQSRAEDRHFKAKAFLVVCLFSLTGFVAAMPYAVIEFGRFIDLGIVCQILRARGTEGAHHLGGALAHLKTIALFNPGLVITSMAACVYGIVKNNRAITVCLTGIVTYLVVFGLSSQFLPRYVLPIYPLMVVAVALFCHSIWAGGRARGYLVTKLLLVCLISSLSVSIPNVLNRTGVCTFDDAGRWIEATIPTGSKILLDNWYGPVIPSEAALGLGTDRERHISAALKSRLLEYLRTKKSYNVSFLYGTAKQYDAGMSSLDFLRENGYDYVVLSPSFFGRFLSDTNPQALVTISATDAARFRAFFADFFGAYPIPVYETPGSLKDKGPQVLIYRILDGSP